MQNHDMENMEFFTTSPPLFIIPVNVFDDSDEDDDHNDDKIYYVLNAFCVPDRILRGLHILSLTFTHKEGTMIT